MPFVDSHRIRDATVHFELPGRKASEISHADFVTWTKKHVLTAVEASADELLAEDIHLYIPELYISLELDDISTDDVGKPGVGLHEKIREALAAAIREHRSAKESSSSYHAGLLLDYFISGTIQRSYSDERWELLVKDFSIEARENPAFRSKLQTALRQEAAAIRFVKTLPAEILDDMLINLGAPEKSQDLIRDIIGFMKLHPDYYYPADTHMIFSRVLHALATSNQSVLNVLYDIMLKNLIRPDESLDELVSLPPSVALVIRTGRSDKEPLPPQPTQKKEDPVQADNGSYIEQAGLVLLTPFLPEFFRTAGLLDEDDRPRNKRELPIILHYLATGENEAAEWKLTLPKILSGLRPGDHCATSLHVSSTFARQSLELLNAVIRNWPALKKTSARALQETFLARRGELRFRNGFYFLHIPEQTVDILLTRVPWNFTTVKLEWMKDLIFVEWNRQS